MDRNSPKLRQIVVLAAVAALVLPSAALGQATPAIAGQKYWLRVKTDNVNLRCRPDVESQIVHQVSTNQVLEAVGSEGGWHRILPPAGTFGLASSAYITMSGPTTGTVATSTGNLRVRVGSTYQEVDPLIGEVIAFLERGASVTVLGKQGDFYKIVPPEGVSFYVSQDFVEPISAEAAQSLASGAAPAATALPAGTAIPTTVDEALAATTSRPGLPPIQPAPTPAASPSVQAPPRRGLDDQSLERDAEAVPLATSSGQLEDADNGAAPPPPAAPGTTATPTPANSSPPAGTAVVTPAPGGSSAQNTAAMTPVASTPGPGATPAAAPSASPAAARATAPAGSSSRPPPPPPPARTAGPPAGIIPPGGGPPSGSVHSTPNAPPVVTGQPVPLASPSAAPASVAAPPVGTTPGAQSTARPATIGPPPVQPQAVQPQTYSIPQPYPTSGPVATISRNLVSARGIVRPAVRVPIGEHGLRYGLFDPYTRRASMYVEFPTGLGLNVSDLLNRYVIVEGEAYADAATRAPIIRAEYITITSTVPGRPQP